MRPGATAEQILALDVALQALKQPTSRSEKLYVMLNWPRVSIFILILVFIDLLAVLGKLPDRIRSGNGVHVPNADACA